MFKSIITRCVMDSRKGEKMDKRSYEKPQVIPAEEAFEGVFAASGAIAGTNQCGCNSKYMNGVWHRPNYDSQENYITRFGCHGCVAFRENSCGLTTDYIESGCASSYHVDDGKRLPSWEKMGHQPYDAIDWGDVGFL